jgi:hypothetical protein
MELGPSTFVGMSLAIVGFLLYIVRTKKPKVSRDYDIFFSSVGFLCGGILIFQGWRLDPILLLCQILSTGTAIFFIGESIWLRSISTTNMNTMSNKMTTEDNVISNSKTEFNSSYSIKLQRTYEEARLSLPYITLPGWEVIDYTMPIEY